MSARPWEAVNINFCDFIKISNCRRKWHSILIIFDRKDCDVFKVKNYYVNQKIKDTQKWRSNLCQELEFARICQWDFVSVVFIFQFVIQQAQFQHVELCRKCFDSFMDYYLGILTHAKTIGDCVKRVISYHSAWVSFWELT